MDSVFKLFLPVFIHECLGFILHKHSGFSSLLWSICSVPQVCDVTKLVYRFLLFFSGVWFLDFCICLALRFLFETVDLCLFLTRVWIVHCAFFFFFLPVSMFLPVPIYLLCCYFCDCPYTFEFLLLKNPAFASYLWVRFMTIWFTKYYILLCVFFHLRECSIVVFIFMHLYWLNFQHFWTFNFLQIFQSTEKKLKREEYMHFFFAFRPVVFYRNYSFSISKELIENSTECLPAF